MMKKENTIRHKSGRILVILGILCIIVSAAVYFRNEGIQQYAEIKSKQVVEEIQRQQADTEISTARQEGNAEISQPMPVVMIDGLSYIGTLRIPDIKVEVPVMVEWSVSNGRVAACRYIGSPETNDIIIAGHNYRSIFGNLYRLKLNAKAIFEDVNGQKFQYQLMNTEIIDGNDRAKMVAGEWDLTLFTCTNNGVSRITLRFAKI